jgi:hypothetical protein
VMLTADDIVTTCGKYAARAMHATPEVYEAAKDLARRLNQLFTAFGAGRTLSSGFRDARSNKAAGGAERSAHLEGKAADVVDLDGRLAIFCLRNEPMLATLGLWMEDPMHTKGWVHLQTRPVLGKRVFKP